MKHIPAQMTESRSSKEPIWTSYLLIACAFLNYTYAISVIFFSDFFFKYSGIGIENYHWSWKATGVLAAALAMLLLYAAISPFNNWKYIFAALVAKMFASTCFGLSIYLGYIPVKTVWLTVIFDLIWLYPFSLILYLAARHHSHPHSDYQTNRRRKLGLNEEPSSSPTEISNRSYNRPQLLVFLRHTGCTFANESISDLAKSQGEIVRGGCDIVVVHMNSAPKMKKIVNQYGLDLVKAVSDPTCELYRAFGIPRAGFRQLFTPIVFYRAIRAVMRGHSISGIGGDSFQRSGVILLVGGKEVKRCISKSAGKRYNYVEIANCCELPSQGIAKTARMHDAPLRMKLANSSL